MGFGGPTGALVATVVSFRGLVALQGGLVALKEGFGGHCGVLMGFGGPTGGGLVATGMSLWGLVALEGSLVTPKHLWGPLWCPYRI